MCLSGSWPDAGYHRHYPPAHSLVPASIARARQYNFVIAVYRGTRAGEGAGNRRVFLARAPENTCLRSKATAYPAPSPSPSRSQITRHFHTNARRNWQPAISVTRRSSLLPHPRCLLVRAYLCIISALFALIFPLIKHYLCPSSAVTKGKSNLQTLLLLFRSKNF